MNLIEELCKFQECNDKYSYTIYVHSFINEELVNHIKSKLDNINKKVNNSFKKKFINDRIFSFITYLESSYTVKDNVNGIFLIDTKVRSIPFTKENLNFCKEWGISKFYMDYDEKFDIDYLAELFSTKSLRTVFKFDKSNYSVMKIDSTKSKVIESHSSIDESSITEYVSKHKPVLLYGMNQILKKLSTLEKEGISIILKSMSNSEIMEVIDRKIIIDNQQSFKKEFIDNMTNPSIQEKLIFGKNEVAEAIMNFMVKKIFVNPKVLKILKQNIEPSALNFEIVIVKPLESGDFGQTLNKDYGGIVGIKYY